VISSIALSNGSRTTSTIDVSACHSDQMAIAEILTFTELLPADHKQILKNLTNASNLASTLVQFVEVGPAQATRLVMQLDSAVIRAVHVVVS